MKNEAIDNKELILALEELEKEKGIKKEYLLESIETALVTAYKRNFDSLENVKVEMDPRNRSNSCLCYERSNGKCKWPSFGN